MKEKTVHIPTITCKRCLTIITRELGEMEGVRSVWGNDEEKVVTIWWERPATWRKIACTLDEAGYATG